MLTDLSLKDSIEISHILITAKDLKTHKLLSETSGYTTGSLLTPPPLYYWQFLAQMTGHSSSHHRLCGQTGKVRVERTNLRTNHTNGYTGLVSIQAACKSIYVQGQIS